MKSPTPEQVLRARKELSLTQTEAAAIIYKSLNAWQQWEAGKRDMDPAFWELFKIKTQGDE